MTWTHVSLLQLFAVYAFFAQYGAWLQPRRARVALGAGHGPP